MASCLKYRTMTVGAIVLAAALLQHAPGFAQGNTAAYQVAMARAVRQAAERVLPSVVGIEVIGVAQSAGGPNNASEVSQDAPSCGIVVDKDGFILASEIIVRRPSASLIVVLPDQTRLAAKIVARDYHRGLVMLKVPNESPLTPIEWPEAATHRVGSTVVAVGRYGGDQSPIVSSGILSATDRLEGTMLQCDARVSPSFYGGPLVDLYGNAIGVLVPAVAPGGAPDETSWYDSGIAFAVPTSVVRNKLDRLRDGTDIRKGLIGIVPKTKDPYADGTELAAVRTRSPAENAGIQPGDAVESIEGNAVRRFQQIKQILGRFDAGETIQLTLQRDGASRKVKLTLAESIPPLNPQRLGIWATQEDDDAAVAIRAVVPGSSADGKLNQGDLIKRIGSTEISDLLTLRRLMVSAVPEEELTVSIERDGELSEVQLAPASISGPLPKQTIAQWADQAPENAWEIETLRLPDVKNLAAYTAPDPSQVSADDGIGLLMLLLPPDKRDPEEILQSWREVAGRFGVVVCAVCSEDEKRWQAKEIDVISRMTTMMAQRVPVGVSAVASPGAIEGVGSSAADSLVVAIALSDRKNFSGISVSEDTKPPAVRLRENEPDRSLEILMPIDSLEDGPTWLAPLVSAGYPIARGGEIQIADLLRWVRMLQII